MSVRHIRTIVLITLLVTICGLVWPAWAGITVSSYETVAQANAYAPLSQKSYYSVDRHPGESPASADVSADWAGTNVGGLDATWQMTVSAHARSATSLNTNSLTITAAGFFAYDLSTTAGFVDPTSVTTLYTPGSGGGYQAYFSIDEPAMYAVTAQLGHYALISLSSVQTGIVYQKVNLGTSLLVVNESGVIPAGQYQIGASVGSGIPNLPDGINHLTDTGTLSNFTFSVNVPEPMGLSLLIGMAGTGCFVRRRR